MSVVVSFKLQSATVTLNAPVYFDLEIANESSETIALDLGHNFKSNLSFAIESPDGVIEVPPLSSSGIGAIGRMQVEPASRYKRQYVLNEWYRFPGPGEYSIQVHLNTEITSASGSVVVPALSAPVKVTVTPQDVKSLENTSEELLNRLSNTTSAEEIANAALALSYVTDPVAVPYIKEALKRRKYSWQYLIPGLARIGSKEAKDLLQEIEKQGDDEAGAALARYYLEALSDDAEPEKRERPYGNPYR